MAGVSMRRIQIHKEKQQQLALGTAEGQTDVSRLAILFSLPIRTLYVGSWRNIFVCHIRKGAPHLRLEFSPVSL